MAEEIEQLVGIFSDGSIREKHEALRKLISIKAHARIANNPTFKSAVNSIAVTAADDLSSEEDRLLSVAILARLWSAVRSMRNAYKDLISEALRTELPTMQGKIDVDDRVYIGKACALVGYQWVPKYCSYAAVMEESGEQARESLLIALIGCVERLDIALEHLRSPLSNYIPDTEEPGVSVARRLRRILSALRKALIEVSPNSGDNPGEVLYEMVKDAFAGVRVSSDETGMSEVVEEVAATINEIIKMRFSLATQSSTYKALSASKKLISEYAWEKLAKKSSPLKGVIRAITESILILAKQGVPADDLVKCLIIAMGNGQKARESLGEIANASGLSPAIRNWLVNGTYEAPTNNGTNRGESQIIDENIELADLLVDSLRYRKYIDDQTKLKELESVSSTIKPLVNYGLGLCDLVAAMAKRRGLMTTDKIGSEIEYAPAEYDLVAQGTNIRRVKVIRPSVHQLRKDGLRLLVRKGIAG